MKAKIASDTRSASGTFLLFHTPKKISEARKIVKAFLFPSHSERREKSEKAYFIREEEAILRIYVEAEFQLCDHRAREIFFAFEFSI
jgi:hypothetical protein